MGNRLIYRPLVDVCWTLCHPDASIVSRLIQDAFDKHCFNDFGFIQTTAEEPSNPKRFLHTNIFVVDALLFSESEACMVVSFFRHCFLLASLKTPPPHLFGRPNSVLLKAAPKPRDPQRRSLRLASSYGVNLNL